MTLSTINLTDQPLAELFQQLGIADQLQSVKEDADRVTYDSDETSRISQIGVNSTGCRRQARRNGAAVNSPGCCGIGS